MRDARLGTSSFAFGLVFALTLNLVSLILFIAPARATSPPRRLVLFGGTLMGATDDGGYDFDCAIKGGKVTTPDPAVDLIGWNDVRTWLADGGYQRDDASVVVAELKRIRREDRPPGWKDQLGITWDLMNDYIDCAHASTAGLARMDESARQAKDVIGDLSDDGAHPIDVIAHSQSAPVVRMALRLFAREGRYPVANLISLGGVNYGESVTSPDLNPFRSNGGVTSLFGALGSTVGMTACKAQQRLPVCPDLFRYGPQPNPLDPANFEAVGPDAPFFRRLNNFGGEGPFPGHDTGATHYWHVYSTVFARNADVSRSAGEAIRLPEFVGITNISIQEFCGHLPVYAVDHIAEWQNPAMRNVLGTILGFDTARPRDTCYHVYT